MEQLNTIQQNRILKAKDFLLELDQDPGQQIKKWK